MPRSSGSDLIRLSSVRPVHARQVEVEQDQVEARLRLLEDAQRLDTVVRDGQLDRIEDRERLAHQADVAQTVLHEQDDHRARAPSHPRRSGWGFHGHSRTPRVSSAMKKTAIRSGGA
jgi:hypothetical protein